jgi:hypothetical protein
MPGQAVDVDSQQAAGRALDIHQVEAQAGHCALDADLRAAAHARARRDLYGHLRLAGDTTGWLLKTRLLTQICAAPHVTRPGALTAPSRSMRNGPESVEPKKMGWKNRPLDIQRRADYKHARLCRQPSAD